MRPTSRIPHLDGLRLPLHAVAFALLVLFLATFVVRNVSLQWDLDTFVFAARAAVAGLDPYRVENLTAVAGRMIPLPFVYPPVTLLPFAGLAALPADAAEMGWIVAKTLLLAGLVVAWRRWFLTEAELLPIALVAVFGWNAAALWDLRAGNVALIECALLWSAFGCFLAGRRRAFALLVVAAACFKLLPAAFLLLLLVPAERRAASRREFYVAAAALAAVVAVPLLVPPVSQWAGFLRDLPDASGLGGANPSAFGLATILFRATGVPDPLAVRVATVAWVVYVGLVLAISGPFLRDVWQRRDSLRWVMTAVFLYVLLSPRPMAYGYVLLAPAPFFFSPRPFDRPAGRLLLALVLSSQGMARLTNHVPDSLIVSYTPFLLTLALWLLTVARPAHQPQEATEDAGPRTVTIFPAH